MTIESDDFTNPTKPEENETKVVHDLLDAAKAYNWQKVLKILGEHLGLINATRPGGKSLYTPLHQAAHGNAPLEIISANVKHGSLLDVDECKERKSN